MKVWAVGAGGLIGSAVARRPDLVAFDAGEIPWESDQVVEVLREQLSRFTSWVGDEPWGIVWAAGAGFMLTSKGELDAELSVFESFCRLLRMGPPAERGGFYLVSSAGGVYAGSTGPPFGLSTEPQPLNDYGRMKLGQEGVAAEGVSPRLSVTIGRVSNAYGPGQDLHKQQGLITHLAMGALLARPTTIFAPLTTLRDYVHVDDVARFIAADLLRMARDATPGVMTRIVSSGRSASIAELISITERLSGRSVPVMHQLSLGPHFLDLRLERTNAVDAGQVTSLEYGVATVLQDLQQQVANGRLAASL